MGATMKIILTLEDDLMPALGIIIRATKWSMDETINRAIITGLQTLNTNIEFAKAKNKNNKAGIQVPEEAQ